MPILSSCTEFYGVSQEIENFLHYLPYINQSSFECVFGDVGRSQALYDRTAQLISCEAPSSGQLEVDPTLLSVVNVQAGLQQLQYSNQTFTYHGVIDNLTMVPTVGPRRGGTLISFNDPALPASSHASCKFNDIVVAAIGSGAGFIHCLSPASDRDGGRALSLSLDGQQYFPTELVFGYSALVEIDALSPSTGPVHGHTEVVVAGTNFVDSGSLLLCRFQSESHNAMDVVGSFADAATVVCTTPAGFVATNATATIQVAVNGFDFSEELPFFFHDAPSVSQVLPETGYPFSLGGTIEIRLSSLPLPIEWHTAVEPLCRLDTHTFAASMISSGHLECVIPPVEFSREVVVEVAVNGQQFTSTGITFGYTPIVMAVIPSAGPIRGGTVVQVQTTGIDAAQTRHSDVWCRFGDIEHPAVLVGEGEVHCLSPNQTEALSLPVFVSVDSASRFSASQSSVSVAFSYYDLSVLQASPSISPLTGTAVTLSIDASFASALMLDRPAGVQLSTRLPPFYTNTGYSFIATLPGYCSTSGEADRNDVVDPYLCEFDRTEYNYHGAWSTPSLCANAEGSSLNAENEEACDNMGRYYMGVTWTPEASANFSCDTSNPPAVNVTASTRYLAAVDLMTAATDAERMAACEWVGSGNLWVNATESSCTSDDGALRVAPTRALCELATVDLDVRFQAALNGLTTTMMEVAGSFIPAENAIHFAIPDLSISNTSNASTYTVFENVSLRFGMPADITVQVSLNGQQYTEDLISVNIFDPVKPPSLVGLTPASGPATGGSVIHIRGSNFADSVNLTARVSMYYTNGTFFEQFLVGCDYESSKAMHCTMPDISSLELPGVNVAKVGASNHGRNVLGSAGLWSCENLTFSYSTSTADFSYAEGEMLGIASVGHGNVVYEVTGNNSVAGVMASFVIIAHSSMMDPQVSGGDSFYTTLRPRCDEREPFEPDSQNCLLDRVDFPGYVIDMQVISYPLVAGESTRSYSQADLNHIPFDHDDVEDCIYDTVYIRNMCMYPVESPNAVLRGCISQCRGFRTLKLAQDFCDTKLECTGVTKKYSGMAPFECRKQKELISPEGGGGEITWRKEATGTSADCHNTYGEYLSFANVTVSGEYNVHIELGGVEIFGSPYPVYVEPNELYEENCVIGDVITENSAGVENVIFIQSKDVFGNNLTTAGGFDSEQELHVQAHQNWCASGWEGAFCQVDEDECSSQPCANGGACSESSVNLNCDVDTYVCSCIPGFQGLVCEEDRDECLSSPCHNGATCLDSAYHVSVPPDSYECVCSVGYIGEHCGMNPDDCEGLEFGPNCVDHRHAVYGRCWDTVGDYFCDCSKGWGGKDCDDNVNACSKDENICDPDTAQCSVVGLAQIDCRCHTGYDGPGVLSRGGCWDFDECLSEPCQHNGRCKQADVLDAYFCTCQAGYFGFNCDVETYECGSSPCSNGGSCIELPPPGSENNGADPAAEYSNGLIDPNATAAYANASLYNCTCAGGWAGENCDVEPVFVERRHDCFVSLAHDGQQHHNPADINCTRHAVSVALRAPVQPSATGYWNALLQIENAGLYTLHVVLNDYTHTITGLQIKVQAAELDLEATSLVSWKEFHHSADEQIYLHVNSKDRFDNLRENVTDIFELDMTWVAGIRGDPEGSGSAISCDIAQHWRNNATYVVRVPQFNGRYTVALASGSVSKSFVDELSEVTVHAAETHVPACSVAPSELNITAGEIGAVWAQTADVFNNTRRVGEIGSMVITFVQVAGGRMRADEQADGQGGFDGLSEGQGGLAPLTAVKEYGYDMHTGMHNITFNLFQIGSYDMQLAATVMGLRYGRVVEVGVSAPSWMGTVVVLAGPAAASGSFASGQGLNDSVAAVTASLTIHLRDKYKNFLSQGGDASKIEPHLVPNQQLPAVFEERPDIIPSDFSLEDEHDGSYTLNYTILPSIEYSVVLVLKTHESVPQNLSNSPITIQKIPGPAPVLVSTRFDSTFIRLVATFDKPTNTPPGCSLFEIQAEWMSKLGDGATCVWATTTQFLMNLGYEAAVSKGDVLRVRPAGNLTGVLQNTERANTTAVVDDPLVRRPPVAVIDAPTVVGRCESLLISGGRSFGGGALPLLFDWVNLADEFIYEPSGLLLPVFLSGLSRNQSSFTLAANDLTPGLNYTFQLTVTNAASLQQGATVVVVMKSESSCTATVVIQSLTQEVISSEELSLSGFASESNSMCEGARCYADELIGSTLAYEWSHISGPALAEPARNNRTQNLLVPSGSMSAGASYVFQLMASMPTTDAPHVMGVATVSFTVQAEALEADIVGGDRLAGADQGLSLVGTASSNASDLLYWWNCTMDYPPQVPVAAIGGLARGPCIDAAFRPLSFAGTLALDIGPAVLLTDPNVLNTNGVRHVFQLNVRSSQPARHGSAEAVVFVVPGTITQVQIKPRGLYKISAAERFSLEGVIDGDYDSLRWYVMEGTLALDAATTTTGRFQETLVINAGQLMAGMMYRFRLAATGLHATGYAEVIATVNGAPCGGAFGAAPRVGSALTTSFTLFTKTAGKAEWADDLEDMPLMYRFIRLRGDDEIPISDYGYAASVATSFSQGEEVFVAFNSTTNVTTNRYTVRLIAVIADQLFAETRADAAVEVRPHSANSTGALHVLVSSFVTDNVVPALSEGNFVAGCQLASSAAHEINRLEDPSGNRLALRYDLLTHVHSAFGDLPFEQLPEVYTQQTMSFVEAMTKFPCEMDSTMSSKATTFIREVINKSPVVKPSKGGVAGAAALRNLLVSLVKQDELCSDVDTASLVAGRRLQGGNTTGCDDCINGECDAETGACECSLYPCSEGRCMETYYQKDPDLPSISEDGCTDDGRCTRYQCGIGRCPPGLTDCSEGHCIPGPNGTQDCFRDGCPSDLQGRQYWQDSFRGRCTITVEVLEVERVFNKNKTMRYTKEVMKATDELAGSMLVGRFRGEDAVDVSNDAMLVVAVVVDRGTTVTTPPLDAATVYVPSVAVFAPTARVSPIGVTAAHWLFNPLAYAKNGGLQSDVATFTVSSAETSDAFTIEIPRTTHGAVGGKLCDPYHRQGSCAPDSPNGRCAIAYEPDPRPGYPDNQIFVCECKPGYGGLGCDDKFTCEYWNIEDEEWVDQGCTVLSVTPDELTCNCTHLTDFAAFGKYRPAHLTPPNPFPGVIMFLTAGFKTHAIMSLTMLGLYLCYILTAIWAWGADKRGRHQKYVLATMKHLARFPALKVRQSAFSKSIVVRGKSASRRCAKLIACVRVCYVEFKAQMKRHHPWVSLRLIKPEDTYTRLQRVTVLFCVLMANGLMVSLLMAPPQCGPQDVGYPDCPWNDDSRAPTLQPLDVGKMIGVAITAAFLVIPVDRLFVAMFRRVRPPVASRFAAPDEKGKPWVLSERFIGINGKFAHIDNLIKSQSAARGHLYRKGKNKEIAKAQMMKRPPAPEHIPDKDQIRLYPAPAPRHGRDLHRAMEEMHKQAGDAAGGGDPQLIEKLWARQGKAGGPAAHLDHGDIVERSMPFTFQFKRPDMGFAAELPNSVGGVGVSAWELEPSLLLANIRSSHSRGLGSRGAPRTPALGDRTGPPALMGRADEDAIGSSPSTPPEDSDAERPPLPTGPQSPVCVPAAAALLHSAADRVMASLAMVTTM